MTWRSDLNKAQPATYKAQRGMRDLYVLTGSGGAARLVKRIIRRKITAKIFSAGRRAL